MCIYLNSHQISMFGLSFPAFSFFLMWTNFHLVMARAEAVDEQGAYNLDKKRLYKVKTRK